MGLVDNLFVEHPFGKDPCDYGGHVGLGGASDVMPDPADIVEIIAQGGTNDAWDGYEAALLRLADGRFMGWSSFYGPTGSGFSPDAYGGDAVVYFANDLDDLIWNGLDAMGRSLCGFPEQRPEVPR